MVRAELVQVQQRPGEVRTPGPRWSDVQRVLIARTDRLGDLILTIPAIAAIRETYPEARLGLIVHRNHVALAEVIRGVDEVLPWDESTALGLATWEAGLMVCIARSPRIAWDAFRARIPHRIGSGRRAYSKLFTRRVDESRRAGERHEVEYALSFAHRCGAAGRVARFEIDVPETAAAAALRWIGQHELDAGFVVLHPGSGGSCPAWPLKRFTELAQHLGHGGTRTVISIGPGEDNLAQAFDSLPVALRPVIFRGTVLELAALLSQATAVISNSTGPIHLAAALGRPALAIHAPWSSCSVARWGPYSDSGWGLVAVHPDAAGWTRRRRVAEGTALLGAIAPEAVLHWLNERCRGLVP